MVGSDGFVAVRGEGLSWLLPGEGAATLGDGNWQTVTEENKAQFRFFKVVVELP